MLGRAVVEGINTGEKMGTYKQVVCEIYLVARTEAQAHSDGAGLTKNSFTNT